MKSGIKTTDPFFYPKREDVERIHNVLIAVRGEKGYVSKGMIDACIEFARTDTHQIIPFPTLITRASAILYSFVTFHPYADGNKRTSLVTASFFLFLNGYSFDIPNDAPEFTKNVALRCLDSEEHSTSEEIQRIAKWLRPHVSQTALMKIFYHSSRNRDKSVLAQAIWVFGFTFWNQVALNKMDELVR